jgi:hypothetical protein
MLHSFKQLTIIVASGSARLSSGHRCQLWWQKTQLFCKCSCVSLLTVIHILKGKGGRG